VSFYLFFWVLIGLNTTSVLTGLFTNFSAGRIGRDTKLPPQFGQIPFSTFSTHSAQKVHSKEHIFASLESGGSNLLQFSQVGRKANI